MTPQAAIFLEKMRKLLADADTMLGVGLDEAAGRTAYLAGFHAAQALIFERVGRAFRTHNGVQKEFLRLTKGDALLDAEQRAFLSRAYNLKAVADYETGRDSIVAPNRAAAAVAAGKRFVATIGALVEAPNSDPEPGARS